MTGEEGECCGTEGWRERRKGKERQVWVTEEEGEDRAQSRSHAENAIIEMTSLFRQIPNLQRCSCSTFNRVKPSEIFQDQRNPSTVR